MLLETQGVELAKCVFLIEEGTYHSLICCMKLLR